MRPDHVYHAPELRRLARPCVYAWRRTRGRWLYVGRTVQGAARFLHGHQVIDFERFVARRDWIAVWGCKDDAAAARLEAELIREHQPTLNGTGTEAAEALRRAGRLGVCARAGCGQPLLRDRQPRKRFCSAKCRNADWVDRNRSSIPGLSRSAVSAMRSIIAINDGKGREDEMAREQEP
jgi:hypothetical protein